MKLKFLTAILLVVANIDIQACTNLIVGKNASTDGSVIVSYSADNYGSYGVMYHSPAGRHPKGSMRKIYEWDTNKYLGEIPQAEVTYNVVGQMNEFQVTVTETTFGGREELSDSTGLIDYGSLMYLALERSKTAREAIKVMTELVDKYGYYSSGESFTVADKNEAWILEMIGKGPGVKGAVWVAVRVPDDCVSAHANLSRITRFDMKDKENVMYSKDVISFARKKGYFSGKDSEFSFRDAYCPVDFGGVRYCDARVWSFFNMYSEGMDKYLDYINGKDFKGEMPLFIKPNRKLSVADVQNAMRDHYEGTPLDITNDLGAGAYTMPYRPTPLEFKVDGKTYFNERPISTQQAAFVFVGQMRSSLPDAVGGVVWWGNDDANMIAFTPVYCSSTTVPVCFTKIPDSQDDVTFSWNSAFWLCNMVSNMVYPYYSKMIGDLRNYQNELETGFLGAQKEVESKASAMYADNKSDAVKYLTEYSNASAVKMMSSWKKLLEYLTVKHLDMCVKHEENGRFKKTKDGLAEPPVRPGYSEKFNKRVVEETGNRYAMPQ